MRKIIVICLTVVIAMCGCTKTYGMPVHQSMEEVSKIELLDMSRNGETVVHALDYQQVAPFWAELVQLSVKRYINDPATEYGMYAIKIYYQNGYIDIIGCDICHYVDPHGNCNIGNDWYYIADDDAFISLIHRFIPAS